MDKLKIIALCLLLSGCSAGNRLEYSQDALQKSDITFAGIPTIFGVGVQGTTFPISPHYSLTAKHVANKTFNKVESYNTSCDLALIYHNNINKKMPMFDHAVLNEEVRTYGYSFIFALPNESEGKVKSLLTLNDSNNKKSCLLMTSTAGIRVGMSGGPVYDNEGKIVGVSIAYIKNIKSQYGINAGITKKVSYSVFVPTQSFQYWLVKELNKTQDKGFFKIENGKLVAG